MKLNPIHLFIFLFFLFGSKPIFAQIENVIVETYYIADTNDATDTTGGGIETGTKTYRIFVDLKPGSKIRKIYGDTYHTLRFESTQVFFNNKVDGLTFAKDFNKNRFKENTVALDTWLSIGQVSQQGTKTYFGVPKIADRDGSFIGGFNSDGGSAAIAQGLLVNADSELGIPVTTSDGIDTMIAGANNWAHYGFQDFATQSDSTIFGSLVAGNLFQSNDAGLINSSGISGVIRDTNQVLIAQLTTKGELSFEINLEIEQLDGVFTKIVKYVAKNDTLLEGESLSPFLSYPFLCGCLDANYLEYKNIYACNIQDSCKTFAILGCMDTSACNFDPKANYNVNAMCCYPGYCNDRDLTIVCPAIGDDNFRLSLFPNPSNEILNFTFWLKNEHAISYGIEDLFGNEIRAEIGLGSDVGNVFRSIDISKLENGLYLLKLNINGLIFRKPFLKSE
jgi:hypothetical protein